MSTRIPLALLLAGTLLASAPPASAQLTPVPQDQGATGLALALRRLPVTASVLYVTAHPDDENNGVLVALARGRGLRTGLLTLTRGEGGQNAVGSELFESLGILRTEELAAVHRYDGVAQYFTRAYEFGFSFSLEETLAKWGHDETLGDVVRVVRSFRPDVILTLPLEAPDHQHHVAAGRLAAEAFRAAADPARFPEQLREGLLPWQARKIYQGGVGGPADVPPGTAVVMLSTGETDPALGLSAAELGGLARSFHKSQAARQLLPTPGEQTRAPYLLVDAEPKPAGSETDVLDGIDASPRGLLRFVSGDVARRLAPGLDAVATAARAAGAALAAGPESTLPRLREGLTAVRALEQTASAFPEAERYELHHRLASLERAFGAALTLAHGLELLATAPDGDVVRGQTLVVTLRAWSRGKEALRIEAANVGAPAGWTIERIKDAGRDLAGGGALEATFRVTVAADARVSQPYWKRSPGADRYTLEMPSDAGLPWSPPDLTATLRVAAGDVSWSIERPVLLRYEGRWVGGEKQKVVNVVPVLSVKLGPGIAVFPLSGRRETRELRVTLIHNGTGAATGSLRLEAPPGWTLEPREAPLRFRGENEEASVRFRVTAPAGLAAGEQRIEAVARLGDATFRDGYDVIAYDHIQERHLVRPAAVRALALDVKIAPGVDVGYVPGAGDEVAEALRQIGAPVTVLSAEDLAEADLRRFTTIVLGVRAYQRKEVRAFQQRLMEYVEQGGHLVVQYARAEFNPSASEPSPFAPYPARVTSSRITDETAPVDALVADSPLLTTPNRIGPEDWKGWVQERAIQLLDARDPRYTDLLAATDPFPKNPGLKRGLLVEARVGKGTWTYVGLVLFRQVAAGTPGAYRLLANLVSRPKGR
jgi:LmbE family N-acetylglucosaminyl deacetylase